MDNKSPDAILGTVRQLGIVGESTAFLACCEQLRKLACCKAPVLIEGETGTGKESAARCLHYLGPRQDRAFIPFNCGAVPESMFENELFGHVQGAYTDAKSNRAGLIAQAHHGTLFLDELDGLPHTAQVALLRFLEDQKYRQLGDPTLAQADVNVIAATNADLQQKVKDGGFRADLLFRLATVRIQVPSLRERREDIPLLARHYVYSLSELYQVPGKRLDASFVTWLTRQDWPGNIRELQNCLHREFLLADGDAIRCSETTRPCAAFTLELHDFEPDYDGLKRAVVNDFDRQFLDRVMRKTKGNVSGAARLIRKDRRAVGRLLDKYGIDRTRYL